MRIIRQYPGRHPSRKNLRTRTISLRIICPVLDAALLYYSAASKIGRTPFALALHTELIQAK